MVTEYGAYGWSYEEVLPLFKKTENNSDHNVSDKYHGRNGPIGVSTAALPDPIHQYYFQELNNQGYQYIDINGANQSGYYLTQSTIKDGIRSSSANGYLESGICPTLTVVTNALVNKILIKPDLDGIPIAYGVQFVKNNTIYTVNANREVIVSAGY